jgi:hypothetical protein
MRLRCPHCVRTLEFTGAEPLFCAYCGKAFAQATETTTDPFDLGATHVFQDGAEGVRKAAPASVGGYRILRRLGGGGMGDVYEAEEASSGQRVALKVIAPQFATSEVAVERFRQEGRLASLISHPRCVFVLAADEQDGLPYIVMELVSGKTLQEYVAERGPLPVEEAVSKILDVIDGLEEAHRLGVMHRDVKPSNCFLLEDGRVKIGDFGLSKSLVSSADLTRTGTFLGTLTYASPEQIKGDRADFRSDVYSVTATLFFLLGGQAPFQGKDAAATLARTVSEAPTPLRSLRPELSPALDKIIRRGLERNPERRWRSLADLRAELARFVPSGLSMGAMGLRAGAIVIDVLLCSTLSWILGQLTDIPAESHWATLAFDLLFIGYFAVLEGMWGWTAGKWSLRLRVCTTDSSDPPGFWRGLWRTVLFYVITNLVADLLTLAPDEAGLLSLPAVVAGVLVLISPMRVRNGYRGLHELLSGTRVVRLPWPKKPEVLVSRRPERYRALTSDSALPDRPAQPGRMIGPFHVRATLRKDGSDELLIAEDPILGRKVLLSCRPRQDPSRAARNEAGPLDAARRNLHRPTRLRWLSAGQQDDQSWDAFLAPAGCPLTDLCGQGHVLSWRTYRGILEELTAEVASACTDGTLPMTLDVEQIWIQPNGRVQLLDAPLDGPRRTDTSTASQAPDARALRLVREASQLALEGRTAERPGPMHAPVPEHAASILRRLMGGPDMYQSVADLQSDLNATRNHLPEVNRQLRAVHLVVLAVAVGFPILFMLGVTAIVISEDRVENLPVFARLDPQPSPEDVAIVMLTLSFVVLFLGPVLWVAWAFLFRGGITLRMMGLTLVRRDGRKAGRWRCAWRSFIVWMPPAALLYLAVVIKIVDPQAMLLAQLCCVLALVHVLACLGLALWQPTRSVHDRLAGTVLVPK